MKHMVHELVNIMFMLSNIYVILEV